MNKSLNLTLMSSLLVTTLYAGELAKENTRVDSVRERMDNFAKIEDKDISEVDKIRHMFKEATTSGQLRVLYAGAGEAGDAYATAVGGILKYELAEYRGFNAGFAAYSSYDMPFASGKGIKHNDNISSLVGNHTDMSEAYLNYKYDDFSVRVGRQVIDTPLADSDDIRMIQNTFEAYVASYEKSAYNVMLGHIQNWHGYDAGLDNGWVDTGDKGTNFGGVSYSKGLEFDAWLYNISSSQDPSSNIGNNSAYFDIGFEYNVNEDILLHMMAQYLNQSEIDNSGIASSIVGGLAEVVVHGIGFNVAINQSFKQKGKTAFSGFGGGTLFTSLDTMILNEITQDRDARAITAGLSYKYDDFGFLYAFGDFSGSADSNGVKEHIVEQDIAASYNLKDELDIGIVYAFYNDKLDSLNDWNRGQVVINYNF